MPGRRPSSGHRLPRTQRLVLEVVAAGRIHAYELKLLLASALGHSSVYAALSRAESKGYVTSEWEHPEARPPGSGPLRKYYEITALGEQVLAEAVEGERERVVGGLGRADGASA